MTERARVGSVLGCSNVGILSWPWIKIYPLDNAIGFPGIYIRFMVIYPVDSAIQRLNSQGL